MTLSTHQWIARTIYSYTRRGLYSNDALSAPTNIIPNNNKNYNDEEDEGDDDDDDENKIETSEGLPDGINFRK